MWDALDITEAEAEGLSELAAHDLALARDFARRAQAAEDGDEASRLGRSYQRAARSYRQTLALKARLKRELAQAAAALQSQSNAPRPRLGGAAVAKRINEVRGALLRLAWDEAEPLETEADDADAAEAIDLYAFAWVRQDVEITVGRDCLNNSFGAEALDDHVARLAMELGLSTEAIPTWRDLPDPPAAALAFDLDDPGPDLGPDRQSSA